MGATGGETTELLLAWAKGDPGAFDALYPRIERELRSLARGYMARERPGHTLEPAALVNEAYLRLAGAKGIAWQGRPHFLGIAARVMRRVLVEHARRRGRAKRGKNDVQVTLTGVAETAGPESLSLVDVIAIHEALERLSALDERQALLVEQLVFGGMTIEEVAAANGLSRSTVDREWKVAKAWLRRELSSP